MVELLGWSRLYNARSNPADGPHMGRSTADNRPCGGCRGPAVTHIAPGIQMMAVQIVFGRRHGFRIDDAR